MSQFVNYSKRSVTLPAGCKNLSDVLVARKPPSQTNKASISGTLADLAGLIRQLSRPALSSWMLFIFPPGEELCVCLGRTPGGLMEASVSVPAGSALENALLARAAERGWPRLEKSKMPEPFPDLESPEQMYHLKGVPQRVPQVAALLAEVLRELAAVDEHTKLNYQYFQVTGSD